MRDDFDKIFAMMEKELGKFRGIRALKVVILKGGFLRRDNDH